MYFLWFFLCEFAAARWARAVSLLLALLVSGFSQAVEIVVTQQDGQPAVGVVVTLENDDLARQKVGTAEMGQRERRFDPHILVVQKGATVSFPNYDDIKHHVFSFSSVKTFEQELYKGTESTPVTFDKAGIVELGCNVHDWMLGYIYIVDTPYFGKTDAAGKWQMAGVPAGEYKVTVWHPGLDSDDNRQVQTLVLSAKAKIQLTAELEEESNDELGFDEFDEYE